MSLTALLESQKKSLENRFPETGVEPDYEIRLSEMARELLRLATGKKDDPNASGEPGLVLDTCAIFNVKRYEKKGLALPDTEEEVSTFLGQSQVEIEGLTNAELLESFLSIKANAGSWQSIENDIMKLSVQLESFAKKMTGDNPTEGQGAVNYLLEIVDKYIDEGFGPVDPDLLDDPEYIQDILENHLEVDADVAEEEATNLQLSKMTIDMLAGLVPGYLEDTTKIQEALLAFKAGETACSDDIRGKAVLCNELELGTELERLNNQLTAKQDRYEELNSQYNHEVGLCFTGAGLGLIGGLPGVIIGVSVTGGIFGSAAADTKDEMHQLEAEIEALQQEIATLNNLLDVIKMLAGLLIGLIWVMTMAEIGINQVITTWTAIQVELESSADYCGNLETAGSVLEFAAYFNGVIAPWEEVEGLASMVTKQFQDALLLWQNNQVNPDYTLCVQRPEKVSK